MSDTISTCTYTLCSLVATFLTSLTNHTYQPTRWTCGCDGNWYKNPSCTNGVNVQDDSKCSPRKEGVASLRTPELLQEEDGVNSECVRQCTSYFQGKDPNSQPNSQNAPDYCRNNENLYGVDFNQCMKDYKDVLESMGSKNGHVGYWCTNKICQA